ncbi:hypothetical protein AVEN_226968-1 [Araneus ventricosus]|uniref:Uncharacterized protein n=1 Tax=Araneus ventricosus TaxID=182803 RepID=A0A4Y2WZH3_ARAVE|nr:hypothetical protein AVEN_226968-1 [Araneus ventricosus]
MMNLHAGDTKQSVETKWRDGVYPANFLKFGENKNDMELQIDGLVDGSITSEKIPVLHDVEGLRKRSRTHVQEEAISEAVELQQSKRQKLAVIKRCRNLTEQSILSKVKELCELSLVRATMRNKLNSALKAVKCEKMQ